MELALEVQELRQNGSYVTRCKGFPVRIGRAWDNDLVIRDPLVDAYHCTLSVNEEGLWLVRDENSLNGTRMGNKRVVGEQPLDLLQSLQIGHTHIRFHAADEPVPRADPQPQFERVIEWMQQPWVAIGAVVIALCSAYLLGAFAPEAGSQTDDRLSRAFAFVLALVVWAGFFGLLARLLRHETAFWGHLTLVSGVVATVLFARILIAWVTFNTLWQPLASYGFPVVFSIAALIWTFVALDMSARLKRLPRFLLSAFFTSAILVLFFLYPIGGREDDYRTPPLVNLSQPPSRLVATPIAEDLFLQRSAEIFDRLDAQLPRTGVPERN